MAEIPFDQVGGETKPSGEIPFEQAHAAAKAPAAPKEVPFDVAHSGQQIDDMTPPGGKPVGMDDGQPTTLGGNPITNPYQTQGLNSFAQDVLDKTTKSAVGATMEELSKPARLEAASVIKAAAMLGVPRGKEMEAKLNPEHRWFPDVYLSDIIDFYDDGTEHTKDIRDASAGIKAMYYGNRALLGFATNVVFDPFNLVVAGTYTRAAKELQKVGGTVDALTESARIADAAANERNLLSLKVPFSGGREVPLVEMRTVQPAIDKLRQVPGVDMVASVLKKLSPDTGYRDVDLASSTHASLGRGANEAVIAGFVRPQNLNKFTSAEHDLIATLVERTPNLKPNLPADVLKAAGTTLSGDPMAIRKQMATVLENVELLPGRGEKLVEAAMEVKLMGSKYLEGMHRAGHLDATNIADKIIEGHLPREIDPAYLGLRLRNSKGALKTQEEIKLEMLGRQKDLENQVQTAVKGSYLSSTDPTRYRSMSRGMTLPEANAKVMAEFGIKDYFVSNPTHAAAIRLLKANKMERDRYLLDTIAKYGKRLNGERPPTGFGKINHPDFNKKTVIIKEGGTTKSVVLGDVVFPNEIAEKMSYYFNPPAVSNIKAQFNSLNRIYRSTSFLSPGFWIRNSADNTVKVIVQGATAQDHINTLKLFAGKLSGLQTEGNMLNPRGKMYSAKDLDDLMVKWGIKTGSAFHDGATDFMTAGKKLTLSQAASSPRRLGLKYSAQVADSMLKGVSHFGEKGENFTRAVLFMTRLREGYTPEMAAREVTKYLFDYTRNSPLTNSLRFWSPFIQHPIKTLLVAPELIGKNPVMYNSLHNTLPHVLAAAFHDPITQQQLNQTLPDYVKARDVVAGPILAGNSLIYDMLIGSRPDRASTKVGGVISFDVAVGMRILNHFQHPVDGLAPIWRAALESTVIGRDRFGRNLDASTYGKVDVANRFNHFISETIESTVAYHNAWNMLKKSFGFKDEKYADTNTLAFMKGSMGQFMVVTNFDKEFMFKQIALGSQIKELIKTLRVEMGREARSPPPQGSLADYVKRTYGQLVPENPLRTYQSIQARTTELQENQLAAQALQKQVSTKDYAERIMALHEAMEHNNKAYQFVVQRYLQMAKDAKNPAEARKAAGIDDN